MKRALFGTTALVAAGALMSTAAQAEQGIKLGLGGYMNQFFGAGSYDNDTSGAGKVDRNFSSMFSDGEVWFLGETTLDNGITFGANVQLESFQSDPDQIDENFAYVSGSFGRVNLGSENSAAYLMQYSAPNVGVPLNSGWISTFVPPDGATTGGGGFRTPRLSTFIDYGNDENQITYFTPRFAGFQVGASYAPSVTGTGDGGFGPADKENTDYNGFAVGVNYVNTLGPVDLAVAGGWRTYTLADNTSGDDPNMYSAGVNVGFSGVTIGGSLAIEDSDRSTDGFSYDAGVSYGQGPWAVGAIYFASEVEGSAASGEDEMQAFEVGASYAVGPGITASASVLWANWEDEDDDEADGILGIVGLKYSF